MGTATPDSNRTYRKLLLPAVLATEQPRRWTRLKGRGRRHLGRGGESRKRLRRMSSLRHRPREERTSPRILSGREVHELSSWGRLPPSVKGRTWGQSQRLQVESVQRHRVVENAMSAAVQSWTEYGSILANTSWTTEDAMAMMAGGSAAEENTGESNVCMPSGFPEGVGRVPMLFAWLWMVR